MKNVPSKIEIHDLLVEIFERSLSFPFKRKYWHTLQLRPWCKGHENSTPCAVQADNTRTIFRTSFAVINMEP